MFIKAGVKKSSSLVQPPSEIKLAAGADGANYPSLIGTALVTLTSLAQQLGYVSCGFAVLCVQHASLMLSFSKSLAKLLAQLRAEGVEVIGKVKRTPVPPAWLNPGSRGGQD